MSSLSSVADARRCQKESPCPGLFRIVQSKDGGICRIKLPLGRIAAAQARVIAEAAAKWGNGEIEITNRANFQIRGIRPANEESVIQLLLDAGLGPKDAAADDIRNVMVSAAHGCDPTALIDTGALAAQILALLEGDSRYHALSPKFSVLLDGGEADSAVDHPHDIWLSALNAGSFAFGFAGHPPLTAHDEPMMGEVAIDHVVPLVQAALDLFLQYPEAKRFRDIAGQPDLAAKLMTRLHFTTPITAWERPVPQRLAHLGIRAQSQAGQAMVGAAPHLGRVSPRTLNDLAAVAEKANGGTIRLTPWSSVLLTNVPQELAEQTLKDLAALGFAVGADDPFAQIVACSGTVGCNSSLADTKHDAQVLALLLDHPCDVQLTACSKSCASARVADYTLVAVNVGAYDLYRRDYVGQDEFGHLIGQGMTVSQAAELMK